MTAVSDSDTWPGGSNDTNRSMNRLIVQPPYSRICALECNFKSFSNNALFIVSLHPAEPPNEDDIKNWA